MANFSINFPPVKTIYSVGVFFFDSSRKSASSECVAGILAVQCEGVSGFIALKSSFDFFHWSPACNVKWPVLSVKTCALMHRSSASIAKTNSHMHVHHSRSGGR